MQKSDNKQNTKSGFKTLLLSVILSSPGPLILGIGLTIGRSSTQISDFTRRSAELLAIIAAFVVYLITNRDNFDEDRRKKLEKKSNIFVGIIMCISGISMIIMAFVSDTGDKGNVLPAFVIALFGVIANTLFWRKYSKLYSVEKNAILGVQARLYGAKSIVDTCVTLTLLVVALWPKSTFSYYFDILGSILVSAYMLRSGIKTIKEAL
ncbi:cation transporter [Butyrivibrio sp. INlla14]|uniref:cation transporter n=1 Tax=Butyrivibrio sp. INlla14 TaxID=1520808 RepID=UPI000875F556|nr:cation transporter [Butyrivibrio sp. INlla14]SCY19331.1 Cation efflux family protein [Butyrivibrio sp. INlla14]